jgi:hypothetical protein
VIGDFYFDNILADKVTMSCVDCRGYGCLHLINAIFKLAVKKIYSYPKIGIEFYEKAVTLFHTSN